jgi:FAD/FMN-containing dehydrogenase
LFARVQTQVRLQAFECFDRAGLVHVLAHHGANRGPFAQESAQYVLVEAEVEGPGGNAAELTADALSLCLADAQEAGVIDDAVVASTAAQARELWALREDISESLHRHRPHKADIAVPVARIIDFVQAWRPLQRQHMPDAEPVVFGHVGDGNLHLNLLPPPGADAGEFSARCKAFDEHTYALVERFGGSISAEHGVGLLKRAHLHYSRSAGQIEMMRAIKRALDPNGLFNPGKIL